ncbi:MAG: hypothetical protein J6J60_07275 [Clostridia bacterium]|nr:hypothetical protein [Clostridia bacterium]
MLEKIKKMFKDENKKTENLIFFLIILVITLVLINRIMVEDETPKVKPQNNNVELAPNYNSETDLEVRLKNILSKISGVGNVEVMITYSESSSVSPLYNETSSVSVSEEKLEAGNTKTTETNENQREILVDSASNPIIEKSINPKIEGAIITAQGAKNSKIKADIVSAVEAATGLATYKIQVFNMD